MTSVNSWFEPNIVYHGHGRAEFANPCGYIAGPVKISFSESGEDHIEMDVTEFQNDEAIDSPYDLEHLLTGIPPKKFMSGWQMLWPLPVKNLCTKFEATVSSPEAVFTLHSPITHYPMYSPLLGEHQTQVLFSAHRSTYSVNDPKEARYWILPLINFVPDLFVQIQRTRTPHPLRANPSNTPLNPFITFTFNELDAFIDPLIDFDEMKAALHSGKLRTAITAVMVGETGAKPTNWTDVNLWLPFALFEDLLGLATGTHVRIPWIEFRNTDGNLVTRLHTITPDISFEKGHMVIRAFHTDGITNLLTNCQGSEYYENRKLRVVIRRLINAGNERRTVEERLSLVIRAFELLVDVLRIEAPTTAEIVSDATFEEIKHILADAHERIIAVADQIQTTEDAKNEDKEIKEAERLRIERVAARVKSSPMNVDFSFGEAVVALCRKVGFADPDVAAEHFGNEEKWQRKLTGSHRGRIMHGGILSDGDEFAEGWRLLYHLHDLGIRIVLRLLGYQRHYSPVFIKDPQSNASIDSSLDWVQPTTPPSDLGYGL